MKKFLFAFLLLICTSNVSLVASDLSDAKSSLKSAQKELSAISSKRDKDKRSKTSCKRNMMKPLQKWLLIKINQSHWLIRMQSKKVKHCPQG